MSNLLDIHTPFSVPLTANAGSFQLVSLPEHQNGHGTGCIGLPVGVSMIRVVWDGETGIRARLETPSRTGPYFTVVPSVGAAVRRASAPIEIPVQEAAAFLRFQVTSSVPAGHADLDRVCGVTVVTTPALSAGGVVLSGLLSVVRWLLGGGGHDHTRHHAVRGPLRSPNRLVIPDDPRSAAQRLQHTSHVGGGGVDAVTDRVAWPVPATERPWGVAHHAGPHELGDTPAGDRHRPTWQDGENLGAGWEHGPGDGGGCHWWAARCCADHPRAELHPLTMGVVA